MVFCKSKITAAFETSVSRQANILMFRLFALFVTILAVSTHSVALAALPIAEGEDRVDRANTPGSLDAPLFLPMIFGSETASPLAVDDDYETAQDTPLSVDAAAGVLANDAGDGAMAAVLVTDVSNGLLRLNGDGSFDYTPDAEFNGMDQFSYRTEIGALASDPATVTLVVNAANDVPVAFDDIYQTSEDTPLIVGAAEGVLANDRGTGLTALMVDDVTNGRLRLNADGSFVYTPDSDFNGQDQLAYRSEADGLTSDPATVTFYVSAVDDAPLAIGDSFHVAEDGQLEVNTDAGVLTNDSDTEQDSLQAVLEKDVSHGTLSLNRDGSFAYTPAADFYGMDTFAYRAVSDLAASEAVTVTLTVTAVNDPPTIVSGAVAFTKRVIDAEVDQAHAVVAADLDGDGDIDMAATDYINGMVLWYQNDGEGVFARKILDAELEGAYPAHVGDVDGDGDADLLAGGYDGDTFVWYRNNGGGSFTRIDIDTAADGAHSIVTGDLDKDGDIDFVTSSQDANNIAWYENDGALNFTEHIIDDASFDAKRAEIADIDGDGDMDVISAVTADHEVNWHENDGNQNFTKHLVKKWASGAYYVSPADADGDGDIDIFSASQWDHTIAWYENDGTDLFAEHLIDQSAEGARTVLAVDIDLDGDVDALSASVNIDTVAWYENDGDGNFQKRIVDGSADGAYGLFATDMDRDGDVDVLSAARDANEVSLHTHIRAHETAVAKGGTLIIDQTVLLTVDIDDDPEDLTYSITAEPEFGQLRLSDAALSVGGTFTQEDVNAGRMTYAHSGSDTSTDDFSWAIVDGGEDGIQPATGFFMVNVAPISSTRVNPRKQ